MSVSPPVRRLSTSSKREEDIINAYEAEEERIINILSRKLEKLREEKIDLENALEAESEAHVNRLSRELTALRIAQQQAASANGAGTNGNGSISTSPDLSRPGMHAFLSGPGGAPTAEVMLDAMKRENEQLRGRLVDTERNYIRVVRMNDIYREELIELRRKLGLSVDNLIGLPSPMEPYSQPTHRRSFSSISSASGSSTQLPSRPPNGVPIPSRPSNGVPIPRPSSRIYRPTHAPSETTSPLSTSSPDSAPSPYPFSPTLAASAGTVLTTPASSASLHSTPPHPRDMHATPTRILSYPSVPPPSLSSSFGSPQTPYHFPPSPVREHSASPERRRSLSRGSRSVERGARVAETGSLLSRSRSSNPGPVLFEENEGRSS